MCAVGAASLNRIAGLGISAFSKLFTCVLKMSQTLARNPFDFARNKNVFPSKTYEKT